QTLFFAFDQQVWRYERQTQQVSGPFAADKSIAALAVSPSNTNLLLAFYDQTMQTKAVDSTFSQTTAQK
ncbi:MAG: hypothetical protein QNJ45_20860, partial [Ardenticatenaceae bacterium]|nr:hypothetical protein [Ardenticatenaceae bacterium]